MHPLILDNCIIPKSRQTLRHLASLAERVVLHFPSPYSLEANVIERLWKQLPDHVTRNHQHPTYGLADGSRRSLSYGCPTLP